MYGISVNRQTKFNKYNTIYAVCENKKKKDRIWLTKHIFANIFFSSFEIEM